MAAQKGDGLALKLGDAASPEVFTTVAGRRTASFTLNSETVDVTSADDTSKYRQLLEGAGVKSMAVSGNGVLKTGTDNPVTADLVDVALNQTHRNWQIVVPGLGTFEGMFQVSSWQNSGDYNGEISYDLSLESAGDIAYTAA